MDQLPHALLLQILSRLDDSADVARCRVASKAFNTVFPDLRSINLQFTSKWYLNTVSSSQHGFKPFKEVFFDLISKQKIVESVCISVYLSKGDFAKESPILGFSRGVEVHYLEVHYLNDANFAREWLPKVSESLKSFSISGLPYHRLRQSNILPLISAYCHNLVNLELRFARLSMDNLNLMPMLASLTLAFRRLEDEHLNELNKCFPNLQVLNLIGVKGLKDPKIHLLHLKTCQLIMHGFVSSWTLTTPNLITLKFVCRMRDAIHIEAPVLCDFHLRLLSSKHIGAFTVKKFENLKTLWIDSLYIGSLLSQFPITNTVENLTLDSGNKAPRRVVRSLSRTTSLKLTLGKVFTVFPNVSSLYINSHVWSILEACLDPQEWDILDGKKGLKTICAYLILVDPSLTFSYVACVLDQCVGLSEVSLLIHGDVVGHVSKDFMSKCMTRWPRLKWRWGIWKEKIKDSWITDGLSN